MGGVLIDQALAVSWQRHLHATPGWQQGPAPLRWPGPSPHRVAAPPPACPGSRSPACRHCRLSPASPQNRYQQVSPGCRRPGCPGFRLRYPSPEFRPARQQRAYPPNHFRLGFLHRRQPGFLRSHHRRECLHCCRPGCPGSARATGSAKVKATIGTADRRGPADNLARHRYNTLVRERYAPTGRLFDIAQFDHLVWRMHITVWNGNNRTGDAATYSMD